ncbi:probable GPI-anchored adhesin-like protein PGA18 [Mastacembelus armatus]|uniref:probable GPI-anchored adhesin-like protein PGA18 n=1 Tax=Mastacembelus armatus TaxID=205130 RepID=UPI000E464067|nr:probable GPI-anchored adhesin-like protein PGA18 [Mastacembelus armatus]
MDTRLVLAVLFVAGNITLATVTAQNETVSANTTQSANFTTPAPGTNLTANVTAPPGTNVTAPPGTNVTAPPGTNVTATPGTNVTATPGTNVTATPGTNTTVSTSPGVSVTGNNTTLATTQAPPLEYNDTVESLSTNISRTGCRSQQLCMAQPLDCDPATGSCYFLAVKQKSGQNFEFELVGEADGYLAATVSPNIELGNNASTYVCAKKNGKVFFISTVNENGKLKQKKLNVNSVKGRINGLKIECSFAATLPSPVTKASTSTSMSVAISTGTYDSSTDGLGTPKTLFQSAVVELTNVNASVANVANTTNTTTPTPNHAITLQQSLTQALLITMGVLCLAML